MNGEEVINSKNITMAEFQNTNMSKIHENIDNKNIEVNKSKDNIDGGLLKKNDSIFGTNLTLNNTSITEENQKVLIKMANSDENLKNKTVTTSRHKRELDKDTKEFTSPKNVTVDKQSTVVKNDKQTNILQANDNIANISINNDNITKIFNKNDNLTDISQTKANMTKILQSNDSTIRILQNNVNITEIHQKQNNTEETNVNDLFKKFDNNDTHKSNQNHDTPKNVKKRDTGFPEHELKNYNPEDLQNQDARNYQNYDRYKNMESYDLPRNIELYDPRNIAQKNMENGREINEYKPYYQNYEMKYKNIMDKTDMLKKDEKYRMFDESHKIIPQIQTRINNDLVKKSFDDFKMVRRKTHYTLPDTQVRNDNGKYDIDRYQDLAYNPRLQEYYDDGKILH